MNMMSEAFSGNVGLGAIDEFLNTTGFEFPDMQVISINIMNGIVDYMRRNLGAEGMNLEEAVVDQAVDSMREELQQERGPDFYKLPSLFASVGLNQEQVVASLDALKQFLGEELEEAVRQTEGVPREIRQLMEKALWGALDYVINDIHPEGQKEIYFMDMMDQFH